MSKQTAVEWLVEELNQKIHIIPMDKWNMIRDIVQQAKEMEKEQQIELLKWRENRFTKEAPLEYVLSEFEKL